MAETKHKFGESSALTPEQRANQKKRFVGSNKRPSFGFTEYGYIYADGDPIPPEYLVRITSYRNNCTIIAPLQENISLGVESIWEPIIPTSILKNANIVLQVLEKGERSAITSSTTRRLWSGTSPIGLVLKLRFEAVQDPFVEVVEPCRLLQTMAVPSDPSTDRKQGVNSFGTLTKGAIQAYSNLVKWNIGGAVDAGISAAKEFVSDLPLLRPPGPSPFVYDNLLSGQTNYTDRTRADIEASSTKGDFIMVELGTFLTFWNVIVRQSGVNFDIKFSPEGYPISAQAEVNFETYEMPTKESLEYAYTKIVPV